MSENLTKVPQCIGCGSPSNSTPQDFRDAYVSPMSSQSKTMEVLNSSQFSIMDFE
jgi:hypothetical protein